MPSNSRSVCIPQEEWEKYRTEITCLFQDHTYAQIIDHLGKKHNFHPSLNQFGTQVQKRWNLKKNVKAQLQVDAFAKVQEREGRPTEILINNRPIPAKKLRKTATAMATAQKRRAEENAHVAPVQMQSGQHKRPRRTPIGPDGLAGEDLVPHPASSDNLIVRTPPAVETFTASSDNLIVRTPPAVDILTASPVPTSSSLAQAHPHSSPFFTFNAWFKNAAACLTEMLYLPSLDAFHPQGLPTSQLKYSGELCQTNPRDLGLFSGIELNPSMQDLADETVSRLQHITLQLARKGLVQNVTISPNLSKFETSLQLLLPMIELASNNLLPTSTVPELLRWISNQRLLWVVEALIDNQLPTTAAFASVLFNGSVAIGDTEIARALLAKGVDPNSRAKPSHGPRKSPLQEAITNADAAMVRLLLSFGARVTNATVVSRRTGWHPSRTDLDIASEGPRIANVPIEYFLHFTTSVLNRALKRQEMEVVKKLLSAGALTNDHHCGHSVTALQTAAEYCDSEAVQLLIDAGADVDIPFGRDYRIARKVAKMIRNHDFFMTPLQHATKRNDIAMTKVLLDNHASVDGFDFDQFFPQGYNAERDYWEPDCSDHDSDSDTENYDAYVKEGRLALRGAEGDRNMSMFKLQAQLYSPLQAAAANKSLTMIHLLLEHHPTINLMGGLGTALQVACMQKGNMEIVRLLVDKGAKINSAAHTRYGQTALQAAILSGDIEVAEYLLDNNADFRAPASRLFGRTALQAAAKIGCTHLARKLIERGADVNETTSMHGETCLHFAARSGNTELVCLLLEHGADANAPPSTRLRRTVLLDAINSGKHEIVEKLLDNGANPRGDHQEGMEYGYVGTAVSSCSRETIELLLQRGANPNRGNLESSTPLHSAIERGSLDLVQLLLSFGADPNEEDYEEQESPLTTAIDEQDENMVRILLEKGAHVNGRNGRWNETPLATAFRTGNFSIIRILLAAKVKLHGEAGISALTQAIGAGQMDTIQFLLSSGLRAKHMGIGKQHKGYSLSTALNPLSKAIEQKNYAAVNMLLAHDTGFYARDRQALQMAVRIGDLPLIQRLLSLRLAFDVEKSYAEALEEVVTTRQVAIAEALLTAGADVNARSTPPYRGTMLWRAIGGGSLAMVRLLIQRGAHINPSLMDQDETTPLQLAVERGNPTVVNLLLHHGADVNAPEAGAYRRTALEGAAENGRLDIVYKILKHDREPQTLEQRIKSAASLARWNGFPWVAKYLEEWQQNTNDQAVS